MSKRRREWVEIAVAVGVALVVTYGQRGLGSVTFVDGLRRLAARIRGSATPVGLPREFLRDLYDGTR